MGFISNIWDTLRGNNQQGTPFFLKSILGYGISTNINTSEINGQLLAYLSNPFVNSIIDKKTEMFINGKMFINDINGNESKSKEASDLMALLMKPNGFQDGREFAKNVYRNCLIFGGAYVMPIDLGLSTIKGFVCLLNSELQIEYDYSLYPNKIEATNYIKRIHLTRPESNGMMDLTPIKDSLLLIKLNESPVMPARFMSKLTSLSDQINTLNVGCDASLNLLRNHGALMIITNKSKDISGSMPLMPDDKDAFYKDYFENFGLNTGKKGVMITSHDLGALKISMPIADLKLDESEKRSVRTIADSYNVPMQLLGFPEGSTFNNVSEAKKSAYENGVIPEALTVWKSFEEYLKTDKIEVYFDHLEIFQESELQKIEKNLKHIEIADQLLTSGTITIQEHKEYLIENEVINI